VFVWQGRANGEMLCKEGHQVLNLLLLSCGKEEEEEEEEEEEGKETIKQHTQACQYDCPSAPSHTRDNEEEGAAT